MALNDVQMVISAAYTKYYKKIKIQVDPDHKTEKLQSKAIKPCFIYLFILLQVKKI